MKQKLAAFLEAKGHALIDIGTRDALEQCPFPTVAQLATSKILAAEADRAILSGGSGIGLLIAANKVPGIRAALVHDLLTAREAVEHLDVQVMCCGGQVVGEALIQACAQAFLDSRFQGDSAGLSRIDAIRSLDP